MRLKLLLQNFRILLSQNSINYQIYSQKLVTKLAIATFATYFTYKNIKTIEDNDIRKVKEHMTKQITLLRNQFGQTTFYPQIKYKLNGGTYTFQFEIDQRKCNLFNLITNFSNTYNGVKNFKVVDFKATIQGNVVTWYVQFLQNDPQFKTPQRGCLTITGIQTEQFHNFRLIFEKNDLITDKDIQALKVCYREASKPKQFQNVTGISNPSIQKNSKSSPTKPKQQNEIYKKLQELGVIVFDPSDRKLNLDWDYLAGYQKQKRQIEDTVLLALNYPQMYDDITSKTHVKFEPNRPKAVLFQGPPGTGKTTSAKIISQQVNIPLIYMPIESIMSKFYGESERNLAELWEMCKKIGKVIIFIDEIDALAMSRSGQMHQASRRILSTLLRKIDSFQSTTDVLLICATNRKSDLDPAMLSRIDLSVKFSLPDRPSRSAIFSRYAMQLTQQQRSKLAQITQGFSGRNINDICKDAQRKWASKLIRKEVEGKLPCLEQYFASIKERKINQLS